MKKRKDITRLTFEITCYNYTVYKKYASANFKGSNHKMLIRLLPLRLFF